MSSPSHGAIFIDRHFKIGRREEIIDCCVSSEWGRESEFHGRHVIDGQEKVEKAPEVLQGLHRLW